jgi:hypothetical protein
MATTTVYTTPTNCKASEGYRVITARFKNPARSATIAIPATPWSNLEAAEVPTQYRAILEAVLDSAAKTILSKHLSAFSLWPSEIDTAFYCEAALIEEATGANSDWLNKEELDAAWRASATRKAWVTSPNYQANAAFRKAVAHYESLILKLAGKTSQYQPSDLDLILAKLKDEDLTTELGSFVVRRIDGIKNRPVVSNEVNLDLL